MIMSRPLHFATVDGGGKTTDLSKSGVSERRGTILDEEFLQLLLKYPKKLLLIIFSLPGVQNRYVSLFRVDVRSKKFSSKNEGFFV